ncbi:hypothetical protein BRADI_1g48311v3 [Brachypodium distachyon]|uniref:DUF569 domain-containing protein n=1 Tax=Brachypodium distachyon TaxID=15368 RepID=A0A0Q3H8U5_BRADI|nr:hypothetical protein BRADI_1g48311v3 [Brachypodium distachyon]
MELATFLDGNHVRLRSLDLGTYLHAAADGINVRLDPERASVNSAWVVHRYENPANMYLLLYSTAFGRYLSATNTLAPWGQRGYRVEQREFDEPEVYSIMWQVIGPANFVVLRHVSAGLLRANGRRRFNWNSGVTFQFRGSSNSHLRHELIDRLGSVNFIMCVRAGRYARLTPMLANLPSGTGNTLYIVAIHSQSPAADELRYPDIDAA